MSPLASAPDAPSRLRSAVEIGFVALGVLVAVAVAALFLVLMGASRTAYAPRPQSPVVPPPRRSANRRQADVSRPVAAPRPVLRRPSTKQSREQASGRAKAICYAAGETFTAICSMGYSAIAVAANIPAAGTTAT
jgi:hypothetical protein